MRYAGFWMRFVAWIVDSIASAAAFWQYWLASLPPDKMAASTIISWAYFVLQESSSIQATLGKRLLGIRVSREGGARLGVGAASIRAWPLYLPHQAFRDATAGEDPRAGLIDDARTGG